MLRRSKKYRVLSFLCLWGGIAGLFSVVGCAGKAQLTAHGEGDTLRLRCARLLTLVEYGKVTQATVYDAWHEGRVLQRYVLVPRGEAVGDDLPQGVVVEVPVQRATVFTSVHAALLNDFGAMGQVVGMCDTDYVVDSLLRRAMQEQQVENMGSSMQPSLEKIITAKSDALLVSPFKDKSYGALEKAGIPLIECADYMEHSPLGRAEWMRFFGRLFGFGARVDSAFAALEVRYDSLKQVAQSAPHRPTLMVDKRENGTWYVPGGRSVPAQLFQDAGFKYVFAGNEERGSVPQSFEAVLLAAEKADIWLIKYGASRCLSRSDLLQDDLRYARFQPMKTGAVYGCNTFQTPFYETTPFRPDRLLQELIHLAHPGWLKEEPTRGYRYYHRLENGN